jgi:hypothetical protein
MAEQAMQTSEHQEGEEEVVEYMGQMGGRIHPAFDSGLQYEAKSRKWRMKNESAVEMCVQRPDTGHRATAQTAPATTRPRTPSASPRAMPSSRRRTAT